MSKLIKFAAILVIVALFVLPGCTGDDTTPTPPPPSNGGGEEEPYGELSIGLESFGTELFDSSRDSTMWSLCVTMYLYDPLITIGEEGLQPGLAESWEVGPDGESWIFYLRDDVKFSNGDDLTAEDVKFSIEQYMADTAVFGNTRGSVDHVEVIDPYTVQVFTIGTQPYYPFYLNENNPRQGYIMPKDYIEENGWDYFQQHPIGSGPYKVSEYVPGDSITFEAVGDHWRMTPHFEYLTFICIPDSSTRLAMLKTGELDSITPSIEQAEELEALGGYELITYTTPKTVLLNFFGAYMPEGADYPIADINVRKALSLAINRDEIVEEIYGGFASYPLAPGLLPNMEDVDNDYWEDRAEDLYRYDPDEAMEILADNGYDDLTIPMFLGHDIAGYEMIKVSEVVIGYWNAIGVDVDTESIDWGMYATLIGEKPRSTLVGSAVVCGAGIPYTSAINIAQTFHSNYWFHVLDSSNPALDALIEASMTEMDVSARSDLLTEILEEGVETYTTLGIACIKPVIALGPRVHVDPSSFILHNTFVVLYAEHTDVD